MLWVYVLAIGAAMLFGLGSVVQQRAASKAPPEDALRLRLLWWLVRQRLWLLGVGTSVVGNLLSGTALGLGSVALVQPLLVTRLLFALPLAAMWMHQTVPRRDWLAALATGIGLAMFIVAGQPSGGVQTDPPLWRWGITVALVGSLTFSFVVLARRLRPDREATVLGAGAGMLFGLQAGLTHTAVSHLADGGLVAMLTSWTVYAVAIVAVMGTLLNQSAYQMAPLTASYPALAAVEPLAGIGIGVGVLGGGLVLSPVNLGVEILGLAVMTLGIFLLATSSLVTPHVEELEARQEEGDAVRKEEELEHALCSARDALDRLEAARPAGKVPHRCERTLARSLNRVDREIARLAELQGDIDRHLRAEREQGRTLPSAGGDGVPRPSMDRLHDLSRRERSLRERAEQLHVRADALLSVPAGPVP